MEEKVSSTWMFIWGGRLRNDVDAGVRCDEGRGSSVFQVRELGTVVRKKKIPNDHSVMYNDSAWSSMQLW